MKHRISNGTLAAIIIVAVIIVDQAIKVWVKTHFFYGEEYRITDWFRLLFIENNGMAWGMEFGSKFFLTWFRIIVAALVIYYLYRIRRRADLPQGYVACIALIAAGAIGNIIDCIGYGVIFNDPAAPAVAQLFPPEGGYTSLFNGRVVDMFYFPIAEWDWPQWMPGIGVRHFQFFNAIFNFADACLSVSVITLILFYSKYLAGDNNKHHSSTSDDAAHQAVNDTTE